MAAVWLIGLLLAISAVHLTLAWRDYPPEDRFENPINRMLLNTLGWMTGIIVFVFAVVIDGIVFPPLAGAAMWLCWLWVRARVGLQRIYWLAAPFGVGALLSSLMMFQAIFGDQAFGLINIFPDR